METKEEIKRIAKEVINLADNWEIRALDSYTMVELLMQLEQHFDVVFEPGEWEEITSLDELAGLIENKQQPK